MGRTIRELWGRTPVDTGAESTTFEVVGWTTSEAGGETPVGRCATVLVVASSVGVLGVVGRMISDDAGKPLLVGRMPPKRDETSPPWVGSSTTLDCAGAAGADEVGSTIAEEGGRTPVDGRRPPKRDERSPP